jgi:D-mannonate dehydratase
VRLLCYNSMPVFGWMRTDLSVRLAGGSMVTRYDHRPMANYAISTGFEARGFTGDELQAVLDEYVCD